MGKQQMMKLLPIVLLLFIQGCYVAPGPGYVNYGNDYEPPAITFSGYPNVIVIPDTYVYAVPDIAVELFFWNGYWWRPWNGRWYRSSYYNRGWYHYSGIPGFYHDVDPRWREYYRSRNWQGHRWNYEPIPSQRLQQNWKKWQNDRHWEKQGTWGVHDYRPKPKQNLIQPKQQQPGFQKRPEQQPWSPRIQQPRQKELQKPDQPQFKGPQQQFQNRPQVRPSQMDRKAPERQKQPQMQQGQGKADQGQSQGYHPQPGSQWQRPQVPQQQNRPQMKSPQIMQPAGQNREFRPQTGEPRQHYQPRQESQSGGKTGRNATMPSPDQTGRY
jgi:hypothetical protein